MEEIASTSSGLNQIEKNVDEFQEAKDTFSDDEEEEEIFYDLSSDLDIVMDRLIDQRRNEIALELRRLNFTDQSTTRSRLEGWFQTSLNQDRQFRSSDIQNEITQLGSIRRVSNVLTTAGARIESVLQNMVRREAPRPVREEIPNPPAVRNRDIVMAINQISREQVMEEISELVHRQLVSSSLRSDFRPILEQRVMDRLNRLGTDGSQTRQFIQNLPAHNIIRNDFSHLGIGNTDDTDSVSSISETRVRNVVSSREIKSLKNEISELKNMLKLSFEMQLDMQRSLKQEINALVNGTFKDKQSIDLINSTKPVTSGKCIICTENDSDTVFYQCGHLCACYKCSMNLRSKNHNCPVCRAPIKDILRTYKCGHD